MRLEGKVAIVTGSARGMGEVEAKLFANEGAKVVVADVLEEEGRKVEAHILSAGGEARFIRLDVTDEDNWRSAVAETVSSFGTLDVLVNNAGISRVSGADILSTDAWDTIMNINAKGVFLGAKHSILQMQKTGGGSIVNISSISSFIGQDYLHPAYNASKGAVRILTKSLASQYTRDGIRVNSVHPGSMPPMLSSVERDSADAERSMARIPMGRKGRQEEVAYAVLFLASDEASYINGTDLVVDGGFLAV